jgi:hypothetical protein
MDKKKIFKNALLSALTHTNKGIKKGRGAVAPLYSADTGGVWNMKNSRDLWKISTGRAEGPMSAEKARAQLGRVRKARAAATVGNLFTLGLINVGILAKATHKGYTGKVASIISDKCHQVSLNYASKYHIKTNVMTAKLEQAMGIRKENFADGFDEGNRYGADVTDEIGWHNFMQDHGNDLEGLIDA